MAPPVFLIAGLGNPGDKYRLTRHNAGFMALDLLSRQWDIPLGDTRWKAELGRGRVETENGPADVVLIRPQTFMNLSGQSVAPALGFYKVPLSRLLVLHDEVELAFADIRLKSGGGHKGHNGIRDIIDKTGEREFDRLRFGVGRPAQGSVADYSLSPFFKEEQAELEDLLERTAGMARDWLAAGVQAAGKS
ncbi:MAG: aminoacyl-tRNA hydrolase [bacterium]|nr:aminoacyl-tRNA hydrolase [bacterium]